MFVWFRDACAGLSSAGWTSRAAGASGCGGEGAFGMSGLLIEVEVESLAYPVKAEADQIGSVLGDGTGSYGPEPGGSSPMTE